MEFTVTAPNRIDLAGGTTDIYPLYLFMGGGCTVNAAVTLRSRVTFKCSTDKGVKIYSEDQAEKVVADSPMELPDNGPLELLTRAVRAANPTVGLEIYARNEAPRGSGLGASSALTVACVAGLAHLSGRSSEPREVVDLAADIETASIAVPTGKQDHIAAAYGGISILDFWYQGFTRRALPHSSDVQQRLGEMLILTYTGDTRFSGMNNWEITRAFIDGNRETRYKLVSIRDVARLAGRALTEGDLAELARLVGAEWLIRRELAPGVTSPRIEAIIASAQAAGALASKVCGAGGGGCMISLAKPSRTAAVRRAIEDAGGRVLDASIDVEGLKVEPMRSEAVS